MNRLTKVNLRSGGSQLLVGLSAVLLTPCFPAVCAAATFAVNSMLDEPDATPGDGLCATARGDCTLRAAIQEANALAGADAITLPPSKMRLSSGTIPITGDLTITGAGSDVTWISGNHKSSVFTIANSVAVTMTAVRIQRGAAHLGGGILNSGSLTLSDVLMTQNRATGPVVQGGLGGALYNDGTLQLSNVTLQRNRATGCGAGLFNDGGSALLSMVVMTGNRALSSGGGIFTYSSPVTLTATTLSGNHARFGGGLWNGAAPVELSDTTLSANSAIYGGAVYNQFGNVTVTNATFSTNRARTSGGGIWSSGGTVDLANVTLSSNRARYGSGLYNNGTFDSGQVQMSNTIVAGTAPNCGGPMTSFGHNLDSGATCGLSAPGDLSNTDPLLGPLQDNGGPTFTRVPQPGSPAIDSGDTSDCPATDQRGVPRPQGAACDIGACEM
jgi:CSLREA domain-containing protein